MSIISQNQMVKADVCWAAGALSIDFHEDSSFIRSETVLVDLMHRSIGIIFQNAYHHIGNLPDEMFSKDIEGMTKVRLRGQGAGNREISLNAPIKILRKAAA